MEPRESATEQIKFGQASVEEVIQAPKVIFSQNVELEELIIPMKEHSVQVTSEETYQADNEFIASVMREFQDKLNESVIFKSKSSKLSSSVTSSSVFDKYLNETITMESPRSSDPPLSSIPTDRTEPTKNLIRTSTQTEPSNVFTQRKDSDLISGITLRSSGTLGITPLSHQSLENIDVDPTLLENLFNQARQLEHQSIKIMHPSTAKPPPYRIATLSKQQQLKTSKESHASSNDEELPSEVLKLLNYGRRTIDHANSLVSSNNGVVVRGPSLCEACVASPSHLIKNINTTSF